MSGEMQSRSAAFDTPEGIAITQLVEIFRAAVAASGLVDYADPNSMGCAMAAASIYAGTMAGTLIYLDLAKEGDKRRLTEMAGKNFRSGINIGKRRALRVEQGLGIGGNA